MARKGGQRDRLDVAIADLLARLRIEQRPGKDRRQGIGRIVVADERAALAVHAGLHAQLARVLVEGHGAGDAVDLAAHGVAGKAPRAVVEVEGNADAARLLKLIRLDDAAHALGREVNDQCARIHIVDLAHTRCVPLFEVE